MYLPASAQDGSALRRLALRARVFLSRRRLDQGLARGDQPTASPALALRAAQLVRPKYRADLATDLERLVEESQSGSSFLSARAPFEYAEVLAARTELLATADALRSAAAVEPRGVAMLTTLLTDATSPLYMPGTGDLLETYLGLAHRRLLGGDRR